MDASRPGVCPPPGDSPSLPGASSSFILTPASAPGPAATISTPTDLLFSSPAPVFSQSSPTQSARASCGRSRLERWQDSSPAGGSDSLPGRKSPHKLYRDVVAVQPVVVASVEGSDPLLCVPSQRSQGKKCGPVRSSPSQRPQVRKTCGPVQSSRPGRAVSQEACGDDWTVVESRRSRKQRVKLERQCVLPLDLVGRCFNCLAQGHFAFQCLKRTRCFRCRELGHRSYQCVRAKAPVWRRISAAGSSSRYGDPSRPESQGSVWRRISPTADVSASACCGGGFPRPEARASVWRRITPPAFCPKLKRLPSSKLSGQMWRQITHPPSSEVDASGDSPSLTGGNEAAGCISSAPLPAGVRPKRKRVRKRRSRAKHSGAPTPSPS
jgi:hypothetical protein